MQLSTKQAGKIFRKLRVEVKRSRHHVAGFVVVDGRKVLPVHYSRGSKDLPGPVPHRFRKSLHLTVSEFESLRDCTLSRDEFVALLKERGIA